MAPQRAEKRSWRRYLRLPCAGSSLRRSARDMERAVIPQGCGVSAGYLLGPLPIERRAIESAMEGVSDGDRILQQRPLFAIAHGRNFLLGLHIRFGEREIVGDVGVTKFPHRLQAR